MIPERAQESAFAQALSLALLVLVLLVVAPIGFAYALVQSRSFWWTCLGAALTLGLLRLH